MRKIAVLMLLLAPVPATAGTFRQCGHTFYFEWVWEWVEPTLPKAAVFCKEIPWRCRWVPGNTTVYVDALCSEALYPGKWETPEPGTPSCPCCCEVCP